MDEVRGSPQPPALAMMNLSSLLNASDGAAAGRGAAAPPPPPPGMPQHHHHQQQQQQQQQQHPAQLRHPSTPVQATSQHPLRDYSQALHASPSRAPSHEYAAPPTPSAAPFASPGPYAHGGPFAGRPAPPALQPVSSSGGDIRSPRPGPMPGPSPSSYRHTPTGSVSGGYPFPQAQPTPASPVQRQQYLPTGAYPPRDSFSSPQVPPASQGLQGPRLRTCKASSTCPRHLPSARLAALISIRITVRSRHTRHRPRPRHTASRSTGRHTRRRAPSSATTRRRRSNPPVSRRSRPRPWVRPCLPARELRPTRRHMGNRRARISNVLPRPQPRLTVTILLLSLHRNLPHHLPSQDKQANNTSGTDS